MHKKCLWQNNYQQMNKNSLLGDSMQQNQAEQIAYVIETTPNGLQLYIP